MPSIQGMAHRLRQPTVRGWGDSRKGRRGVPPGGGRVSKKITWQSDRPPRVAHRSGQSLQGNSRPGWAGSAGSAPHPGSYRVPPRRHTQSRHGAPTPPGKWSPRANLTVCQSQASKIHPGGDRGLLSSGPQVRTPKGVTRFRGPQGSSFPWQVRPPPPPQAPFSSSRPILT